MSGRRALLPLCAGVLLAACTFDYSDAAIDGGPAEELPSVEILDARMVIVRENRIELTADRIATYNERREQEFTGLRFVEFGPDGRVRIEGEATAGVLNLDTEDLELTGTVRVYSSVEDAALESEFLSWQNAERLLTGRADSAVTIERSDGSRIEGRGLRLDGRRNQLEFSAGVDGVYRDNSAGDSR